MWLDNSSVWVVIISVKRFFLMAVIYSAATVLKSEMNNFMINVVYLKVHSVQQEGLMS